jgi:hypothetical protein
LAQRSFQGSHCSFLQNDQITKPQEAKEALFQQAAVSSSFCRKKGLPTTPWIDAIQQNIMSKKYYNKIIYQSITLQSYNLSLL